MNYICPKCRNMMVCISTTSIPPIVRYECLGCGYSSKPVKESPQYIQLPKELWSEEEDDKKRNY